MRKILEKLFCPHDWEREYTVRYQHEFTRILFSCKKCGKFKKKRV